MPHPHWSATLYQFEDNVGLGCLSAKTNLVTKSGKEHEQHLENTRREAEAFKRVSTWFA